MAEHNLSLSQKITNATFYMKPHSIWFHLKSLRADKESNTRARKWVHV